LPSEVKNQRQARTWVKGQAVATRWRASISDYLIPHPDQ